MMETTKIKKRIEEIQKQLSAYDKVNQQAEKTNLNHASVWQLLNLVTINRLKPELEQELKELKFIQAQI